MVNRCRADLPEPGPGNRHGCRLFQGGYAPDLEDRDGDGDIWLCFRMGYTFYLPLRIRYRKLLPPRIHGEVDPDLDLEIPLYKTIAIALEFSDSDTRIISHALGQIREGSELILIHIVESASARMLGQNTFDEESKEDERRLQIYVDGLKKKGINARGLLGYRNRISEIIRLVKETESDMLIMGAHRHSGLQDFIHGETINSVRHGLKIPILVVNV